MSNQSFCFVDYMMFCFFHKVAYFALTFCGLISHLLWFNNIAQLKLRELNVMRANFTITLTQTLPVL